MTLREQMAMHACAILNTEHFGERALWTPYGQTAGSQRYVRLIEQPDAQQVRRAHVWTEHKGTATSQGDTFRVKRGTITSTWRVLFTDPAESALQRSYCHLQLSDTLKVTHKYRIQKRSGSTSSLPEEVSTSYRCQWFESSAEVVEDNRRRALQGEWYCLLETVPDLRTDMLLTDSAGRPFRVERLEKAFNLVELPYLICTRSDV